MDLSSRFECERCERSSTRYYIIEDNHAGDVICGGCGLVVGDRFIDVSSEWGLGNFYDTNETSSSKKFEEPKPKEREIVTNSAIGRAVSKGSEKYRYHAPWTSHSNRRYSPPSKRIVRNPNSTISQWSNLMVEVFGTETLTPISEHSEVFTADAKTMEGWISHYCDKLQLSKDVERESLTIADRAKELGATKGRTNTCVAASSIYMAAHKTDASLKIQTIAQMTGTSVTNIRKFCEELAHILH